MALTNRQRAFEMYKETNGEITNRAIALELDVPEKTISSWKSRYKWDAELGIEKRSTAKGKVNTAKGTAKSAVDEKKVKKRSGNPNPNNQFLKRNQAAVKHGLFSKYLNPEQLEIMEDFEDMGILDALWLQIKISFSNIIRAQKIMGVINERDHLKEESSFSPGEFGDSHSYKVVYAHERFETLIKAQTKTMAEHRNLVKQFLELSDQDDERRLKLEAMQLNVVKAEIDIELKERELELLNDDNADKSIQINFVRK